MSLKQNIYLECIALLNQKAEEKILALKELASGLENDAKSSAGDKHETARAMMQQEQEKLDWQLNEINIQKEALQHIDISRPSGKVMTGSLVKTDKGYLFLSVAIGKINIAGENIIVLSPQSPLGHRLAGLQKGDTAELNGNDYKIEEIS